MFRKIFNFNLILALIFLLSSVFPSASFSYETKGEEQDFVDESLDYKPVVYKKVRCPQCYMEFYYIEGKESPHSHWVHYEVEEEASGRTETPAAKEESTEAKEKESFSTFFSQEEEVKSKLSENSSQIDTSFPRAQRDLTKRYELRQKLTCPYDGYSFFPGGDIIEERKTIRRVFSEEMSVIESSFSKSIPFGVSKELRQFGYNLFVLPEEAEQEVQSTAEGSIGEGLSALGMLKDAFNPNNSASSSFSAKSSINQTAVVPIGPYYVIGPGDTLVINIWGSVQESFPVEVDREGKIMLPKAGPLYLWGLKFQEAENRIKERLNQFYTNFNVDVSMGKIRNIQVFVMGEVKKPGSYAINSQSTIFQVLYAAGGPTKLGSLRKIKLIHGDAKEEKIDLYPFLLEGSNLEYSKIQSGDTVFVPAIGDVVALAGNVKRPAIYETKSEIPLADLLSFAGGITPTGDIQRLQVERIQNNERRIMLDMELKRTDMGKFSLEDINMQNGDLVMVLPIVRLKHDFISILGNVERPGDYALSKDMRVSDLIERAKGFMPGTYIYRAEIARVTKDRTREIIPVNLEDMRLGAKDENVLLNEWDILLVYSEAEVQPPSYVEITGAVNKPGKYELTPGMKMSDLIFKGGGAKLDEVISGAELFHIMPGEQPVVRTILAKRISGVNISIDKDIILRAGDSLFVKSEPKLTERKTFTIEGEVRFPGTYSIREGEKLISIIERAGGFTKDAFLEGAFFTRQSIKEIQEKMREKFLEKETRTLLEEQQAIVLKGSTTGIVATPTSESSLDMRREMLDFIKSAEIEGRMVIKLMPIAQLKGTRYDILLEGGDALNIPQMPSAVAVMGSVNNPMSIPFERGKGIEYYIRRTGGYTRHADKSGIYVIRANGEAASKFTIAKKVGRGDTIVIPQRFKYFRPPYDIFKDTVEMLSRIAIGIGIIAALD
ncbi:SLBB domain-containing protein [Candidatus Omnitrophota bacterium]